MDDAEVQPDVRHDVGYQWRQAAGHRDRMPGATGTRSPIKGPLVEDRRTKNEIAERLSAERY
ncbi:hypothetical protein JG687_00017998 [Phytophthora cactorum]|uniref:Uncharacterized protein n=2 Tax=Phytophthora TaxID=4783 RepID=A0A8J5IAL9_9STRA|nr:hypothetical protein JG688_00017360 [Phytophthora aleatoria]KAG6944192.1 hypothetical protein JG687_00017998 [Phytophthora cactorum]